MLEWEICRRGLVTKVPDNLHPTAKKCWFYSGALHRTFGREMRSQSVPSGFLWSALRFLHVTFVCKATTLDVHFLPPFVKYMDY